jgi:hypothetical protein
MPNVNHKDFVFDHIVVQIDNDQSLLQKLKNSLTPLGIPFEPTWGKGTKEFQASNIWIGRQYLEIVRILNRDGGGWPKSWVDLYFENKRGAVCIFFKVPDIHAVADHLKEAGFPNSTPQRISFKYFFGLFAKTLPWQLIYTPTLPGTNIQLGFISYDPDPKDRMKTYMVPNADEYGIIDIHSVHLETEAFKECALFLSKIFTPVLNSNESTIIKFSAGSFRLSQAVSGTNVKLFANSKRSSDQGKGFQIENVQLIMTTP